MNLKPDFIESMFNKKRYRFLLLGLDGAGKSTILQIFKKDKGQYEEQMITPDFYVKTVEVSYCNITSWDIKGGDKIRQLWKHYYQDISALIYVVDSDDKEKIELAREELHNLLSQEELKDALLLVLANKEDYKGMSISEVTEKLGLETLEGRNWRIEAVSALTGHGFYTAFTFLNKDLEKLKKKK